MMEVSRYSLIVLLGKTLLFYNVKEKEMKRCKLFCSVMTGRQLLQNELEKAIGEHRPPPSRTFDHIL